MILRIIDVNASLVSQVVVVRRTLMNVQATHVKVKNVLMASINITAVVRIVNMDFACTKMANLSVGVFLDITGLTVVSTETNVSVNRAFMALVLTLVTDSNVRVVVVTPGDYAINISKRVAITTYAFTEHVLDMPLGNQDALVRLDILGNTVSIVRIGV